MGETEKKAISLSGKVVMNVLKIGVLAVVSGAMLLKSKDLSKETLDQAKQVKNIIKTAISDAIEAKKTI